MYKYVYLKKKIILSTMSLFIISFLKMIWSRYKLSYKRFLYQMDIISSQCT